MSSFKCGTRNCAGLDGYTWLSTTIESLHPGLDDTFRADFSLVFHQQKKKRPLSKIVVFNHFYTVSMSQPKVVETKKLFGQVIKHNQQELYRLVTVSQTKMFPKPHLQYSNVISDYPSAFRAYKEFFARETRSRDCNFMSKRYSNKPCFKLGCERALGKGGRSDNLFFPPPCDACDLFGEPSANFSETAAFFLDNQNLLQHLPDELFFQLFLPGCPNCDWRDCSIWRSRSKRASLVESLDSWYRFHLQRKDVWQRIVEIDDDDDFVRVIRAVVTKCEKLVASSVRIFEVKESNSGAWEEDEGFNNRFLLWHSTWIGNIKSILTDGFLTSKAQRPGKGFYFADLIEKTLQYCGNEATASPIAVLLCEVDLGNCEKGMTPTKTGPVSGYQSFKLTGSTFPDPERVVRNGRGAQMYCGDKLKLVNDLGTVRYNEYVVSDPSRIKVRYLVSVERKKEPKPDRVRGSRSKRALVAPSINQAAKLKLNELRPPPPQIFKFA